MRNFVFIAPPAAGKGTQSKLLVEKYGYSHISTGDLLREEVAKQTELGIQINDIMKEGKLVDDDIVKTLLENSLTILKKENKPFIIDGFPRTLNQARMLVDILNNLDITSYRVIYMDLDYEEAMKRVLGRMVCPNCGKSYNKLIESLKPQKENVCDSCQSNLEVRSDDNEETFKNRYDTFIANTKPIINYFSELNKLINISAAKNAEEIFKDIETYVAKENN